MKYKAVIFDMDGLLIDTEQHWHSVEIEIWESVGIPFTKEFQNSITGLNMRDIIEVAKQIKPSLDEKSVVLKIDNAAQKVYEEMCKLQPFVKETITAVHGSGLKMAIASSSKNEWISMFLNRFGFKGVFEFTCSTQSMGIPGKPNPDIYTYAINRLGVQPEEVIVFEDTSIGSKAAKAAGAYVVAVPDSRWSHGDFSHADEVLTSLQEFNFELLKE